MIGETISHYQILSRLGAGGMGVVYEAYDQERRQLVALKLVTALSREAALRFRREFGVLRIRLPRGCGGSAVPPPPTTASPRTTTVPACARYASA